MNAAARPVVLAVDGGGSKTDLVLIGTDGELLVHVRGDGSRPQTDGIGTVAAALGRLRAEAVEGVDAPLEIVRSHVYLSGLDFRHQIVEAAEALASWPADVADNDMFALLRSGSAAASAVAVVCGTGINAVGVRPGMPDVRFPALGEFSGDWGGGAFIGARALWHAARAEDGRGPETALRDAVARALGFPTIAVAIETLYGTARQGPAVRALCPVLFDIAEAGDPVAARVVDRLAEEVATMAITAIRRLDLLGTEVPVVLGGGVLAAGRPQLMAGITARLAAEAPLASPRIVREPPILGAGLLALGAAGGDAAALAAYEAAVRSRSWPAAGVAR